MSQRIHLDATPGLFHQVLHCHQGDVGRQFEIAVVTRDGYEIPSGATFKIQATKPSGLGFTVTGTAANNIISFTSTEDMTSEAGEIPTQLEIKSGNDVIYTSNFLLVCETNVHPSSVTDGSPEEIISEITLLVERAESAASTAGADAAAAAQARVDEMMNYLPTEVTNLKSDLVEYMPITWGDGYINLADGTVKSSNAYKCTDVITISDTFSKVRIRTITANDDSSVCFYKDGVYISGQNLYSVALQDNDVTIPATANQVRFTCRVAYYTSASIRYIKTVPALVDYVSGIQDEISFVEDLENDFNPSVTLTFTSKKYIESDGSIKNINNTDFGLSQAISVNEGENYVVSGWDRSDAKLYVVLDKSGNSLAFFPSTTQNQMHTNVALTIPENGATLYVGRYSVDSTLIQNISVADLVESSKEVTELKKDFNQINSYCDLSMFSYIGVCGDSYTEGNLGGLANRTSTSWGKVLGRMSGINVTNYAKGGTTLAQWITQKLPDLLADTAQQLYVFCFGINDEGDHVTLGTIADIKEDYTQNPDTFYGNYGRVIDQVKAHAPNALLVLSKTFLPHYGNGHYYTYSSAAIEEIADHYDIPFIETADDDFIMSDLFIEHMLSGHPLAAGYSGLAKSMYRLMNRLIDENIDYFNTFIPSN